MPTRTINWQEPRPEEISGRSGLEYLQAMLAEELPAAPIAGLMNLRGLTVSRGDIVFEAQPDESHFNPIGSVHGGFYATLLDSACACAVQSTLPAGVGYTSLELKVSFVSSIGRDLPPVRAHGWIVKPGRRAAFAEADVRTLDGELLATASSTCLVFPIPPAATA